MMANGSPDMPSGPLSQVFFPPGGSSPSGLMGVHYANPVSLPAAHTSGFTAMDTGMIHGLAGTSTMPFMPPSSAGVSFIIQIGLTRESVLLPQTADLAYVKQIACSIVDQKVSSF